MMNTLHEAGYLTRAVALSFLRRAMSCLAYLGFFFRNGNGSSAGPLAQACLSFGFALGTFCFATAGVGEGSEGLLCGLMDQDGQ